MQAAEKQLRVECETLLATVYQPTGDVQMDSAIWDFQQLLSRMHKRLCAIEDHQNPITPDEAAERWPE